MFSFRSIDIAYLLIPSLYLLGDRVECYEEKDDYCLGNHRCVFSNFYNDAYHFPNVWTSASYNRWWMRWCLIRISVPHRQ